MADKKMYKVGITVKEPWAADISYEPLDMALWRTEDGGDGCSYTALKANIGVKPDTDPLTWVKSTQSGQSIYDLAVKRGYTGTEDEFVAAYEKAVSDAKSYAEAARTEAGKTAALNETVSEAEAERQRQEEQRLSAEEARAGAETLRQSAEESRESAEESRISNEETRQENESVRRDNEGFRVGAEESRRTQFESLRTDMENAIKVIDETSSGASEAEKARSEAEAGRAAAEAGRVAAETGREKTASDDHALAASDHARAEEDHSLAAGDHADAVKDHDQAEKDHETATGDRETAASDHDTAVSDHEKATEDHTTAQADHDIVSGYAGRLDTIETNIEELLLGSHDHMAAAWAKEQSAPAAVAKMGDTGLFNYDFFLIDHTRNNEEFSVPKGKLRRNNILRFDDGAFAPAVGITEAQYAECAGNDLYLDDVLYAEAGKFDAKDFYENHCSWKEDEDGVVRLHVATLRKGSADGDEVTHYLLPWETAEKKYSIMLGVEHSLYMLQNVQGTSGKVWNFISTVRKTWDGETTVELKPTAFSPCPVAVITQDGKRVSRSFFYNYDGESAVYGNGAAGDKGLVTMFRNTGRTFPATSVMTQVSSMQYARNGNPDVEAPVPFAEGGWHTLNTFLTFLEIKYGTRALHANSLFGSGISSNDSCANENTWRNNGGVRVRKAGDTDWEYRPLSQTPAIVKYDAAGASATNWSNLLNGYRPKEACMESQMAASVAAEAGVPEGTPFEAYGEVYTWASVPGAANIEHGHMNAIVRSVRKGTFNAFDTAGNAATFDVEVSLRMSLFEGANLSGDIYAYWGGGMECIGTCVSTVSGHSGDPVDLYLEPEQKHWVFDTVTNHNDGAAFKAEGEYEKVGEGKTLGDGYSLADIPLTPWCAKHGGGLHSGMGHYDYGQNYWSTTVGGKTRIGVRVRGYASLTSCSPRFLSASRFAGHTITYSGGSAQVRLPEGAAPLQAE